MIAARVAGGRLELTAGEDEGTGRTLCAVDGRLLGADELAPAYEREGEALLARLRGEFTVVLWDRERGRGIAARDRMGQGGLFVCERDGTRYVATEVRDLLALLPTRPEPDEVAVAHWLARTQIPDGRTLYAGVRSVAPGHVLRLESGDQARTWTPTPAPAPAPGELLGGMRAAVERATLDSGRTGVLLSGGLDSGAVAALAGRPRAYSMTFPAHPSIDESEAIAATGLDGVRRAFGGGSALDAAREFLAAYALPPPSPNGFVWRPLVRAAAAEGIETLLDGEGGDELLGCAPYLIADALRGGRPDRALGLARRLPGMGEHPRRVWLTRALRRYGARGALPYALHERLRARRASPPPVEWLSPAVAAVHRETHDPWGWKRTRGPRWSAQLTDITTRGADALGANDHHRREAALAGVVFRHPLRDPDLLETVLAIDPATNFDPRLDRPLARAALDGLLPDAVRLSQRKPYFNAVLEDALAGPDAREAEALLGGDARTAGLVDLELARDAMARIKARRARLRDAPDLWRVLTLELWLRAL